MALVALLCLRLLHYIYSLVVLWHSLWQRITWTSPQPLDASRHRIPNHLAVILVTDGLESESCLVQSVTNAVDWCRAAGIEKLTVYEEHGKVLECSQNIRDTLVDDSEESSSESEIGYPTPPPSDYSESRPISPQHEKLDMRTVTIHVSNKQTKIKAPKDCLSRWKNCETAATHANQKQLTLCLASRESSKPAIAAIAGSLVSRDKRKSRKNAKLPKSNRFTLTVDALDHLLESDHALSSPEFMIVHSINPLHYNRTPLELHGYPPWHIRLTEIYHNRFQYPPTAPMPTAGNTPLPLDKTTFTQALDEFTMAEMRFGK